MACKTKSKLKYATGGQMTKAINKQFLPTYIGDRRLYSGLTSSWLNPNSGMVINPETRMMNPIQEVKAPLQLDTKTLDTSAPTPEKKGLNIDMGKASGALGAASGAMGMITPLLGEDVQKSKGMGAASGVISGASMGASLGPIGMAAGAVLGGVTGFLGAKKAQKAEQRAENERMFKRNSQMRLNSLQPQQEYASIIANGGEIPPAKSDPMMDFYNAQAQYTGAFQRDNPKIPVNDILNEYANRKDFSLRNLDQYAKELTDKWGDISLSPERMMELQKQGYPDIMALSDSLKQYDMNQHQAFDPQAKDKYIYADTSGTKDTLDQRFGWRNLLQRSYPEGSVPYKYLDNTKADGGPIMTNVGNIDITDRVSEIKSGLTHEQSLGGGVPIGQNALLEDKEFIYTMKNGGKYVFSNRF